MPLLVLFAGTMLVIAGCSSPTGSDGGAAPGAGTFTITGSPGATEFNGTYPVSSVDVIKIAGETDSETLDRISGSPDIGNHGVAFCLEQNSNPSGWVRWNRNDSVEEMHVYQSQALFTQNEPRDGETPTTNNIGNRRPVHTGGKLTLSMEVRVDNAVKIVNMAPPDSQISVDYTLDINQMDIRVLDQGPPCQ